MFSPANVNKQDVPRGKEHAYPVKHTRISTQFTHVRMYICMYVKYQQAFMWVHKDVKGMCTYMRTCVHKLVSTHSWLVHTPG